MARPTKLTDELIKDAEAYIYSIDGEPAGWTGPDIVVPTIEGLAVYLHVSRDSIYEWVKSNTTFSDIIEDIRAEQARTLVNKGLSGAFNSTITKLMLNKHGYVEKNETDLTSNGETIGITGEQAEQLLRARTNRGTV